MNPAKKFRALVRGLPVKSRRIAGMMFSGDIVTTRARGIISPMTTLSRDPSSPLGPLDAGT
jgi:hypothetical protein